MAITREQLEQLERTDDYYDWVIDYLVAHPEECYSGGDGRLAGMIAENGWDIYRDMDFNARADIAEAYVQDA